MRTLYIDPFMGAAGDMITASLLGLFENSDVMLKKLNGLEIPGVVFETTDVVRCGISGLHVEVSVDGEVEHQAQDVHEDEHHHHHDHHHHSLADIEHIIYHMNAPQKVKDDVANVYKLIADAEAKAHGTTVELVHFHEVGAMDAVADVAAAAFLINELAVDRIVAGPVRTGFGQVKCAHGIMPVPTPATANLLTDIPSYAGDISGEMCTPTGAALIKYFAQYFGRQPMGEIKATGYGAGTKDFPQAPNVVRTFIIESDTATSMETEVVELDCNVDDMTGEEIAFATERLLALGARDVFTETIYMKKNRPGIRISVICTQDMRQEMAKAMFAYTTTIGIREKMYSRMILDRHFEEKNSAYGPVKVKISEGFGIKRVKPEFEDLKAKALENNVTISEVRRTIE